MPISAFRSPIVSTAVSISEMYDFGLSCTPFHILVFLNSSSPTHSKALRIRLSNSVRSCCVQVFLINHPLVDMVPSSVVFPEGCLNLTEFLLIVTYTLKKLSSAFSGSSVLCRDPSTRLMDG